MSIFLFGSNIKYMFFRDPIRQMLFTFRDRCRKIDDVKLFANDIVVIITEHLQHIKAAVIK